MLLVFGEDGDQRSFRDTYCLNYLILITNLALTHLQHVLLHHEIYTLVTIIRARGGYKIIFLELISYLRYSFFDPEGTCGLDGSSLLFLSWSGCTFDFTQGHLEVTGSGLILFAESPTPSRNEIFFISFI